MINDITIPYKPLEEEMYEVMRLTGGMIVSARKASIQRGIALSALCMVALHVINGILFFTWGKNRGTFIPMAAALLWYLVSLFRQIQEYRLLNKDMKSLYEKRTKMEYLECTVLRLTDGNPPKVVLTCEEAGELPDTYEVPHKEGYDFGTPVTHLRVGFLTKGLRTDIVLSDRDLKWIRMNYREYEEHQARQCNSSAPK